MSLRRHREVSSTTGAGKGAAPAPPASLDGPDGASTAAPVLDSAGADAAARRGGTGDRHLLYFVGDSDGVWGCTLAILDEIGDFPVTVRSFARGPLALAALRREPVPPTVVMCEQRLPGGDGEDTDGVSFLAALRRQLPDTVRVLLTDRTTGATAADRDILIRAINEAGIFQYVERPCDREALHLLVRNAIEHGDLVSTLRRTVQALRGNNDALSLALRQIHTAQERLVESERMAAVGRVASGIAHEIGNQLSVLTYAELIRDRYPDDGEIRLFTAAILSARARLGGLVGEIRDFSRVHGGGSGSAPGPGDGASAFPAVHFALTAEPVALSVQEALSILRFDPAFRLRSVERAIDCPAAARVNRDKLVQVLLNLLRNAVDATPPGGEIVLRLDADPPPAGPHPEEQRPMVRLLIEDHGEGIPPAVLARIFEPFFTTKGDRGTGLGLGICRSIIAQHGGELRIESPIPIAGAGSRSGTRVTVTLPRLL